MKDHVHERIGFREIDEHGNAVQAVSPHVPEPADQGRKRTAVNPFIVALWVMDVGVVWFCMWAFTSAESLMGPSSMGSTAQVNFMILSTLPYGLLAAILLTAGLLFWHAVQWQKKRPTR
ncbi:hypothetical protein FQP90_18865 [Paenarthrobacter nitroguajacolicus]|uniref:Uncharacterized protein n=1 Tax=Paenarthrobacter nitroguajacolicus TaxID=211146 RepID=A0A558GRE7_PAENT|nr:hypothetical protein [Paenarthrobacter nitroguajacolicus]TVU59459.1 hypothetical protein FQP90_18865 [Paenarthrobacter nitroguajacolicus]